MLKLNNFSPPRLLDTAVLFLVFNRLNTTKLVFDAIKKAKPPRIYIASDGARAGQVGEKEKVEKIREFILSNIDWKCEVKTLFRSENLGCKYAVSGAIDWFFESEEMGIILEDDCLPSQSFFWYCEDLLMKYKNDMRVWHISGNNFANNNIAQSDSYYFLKNCHIWGWGTWANRWSKYDVEIKSFKPFNEQNLIRNIFNSKLTQKYWRNIFENLYKGNIDTWDYQWAYTIWINSGLSISPSFNLVSNIGFGPNATHTKNINSPDSKIPCYDITFPIKHPSFVIIKREWDTLNTLNFWGKVFFKLKLLIK